MEDRDKCNYCEGNQSIWGKNSEYVVNIKGNSLEIVNDFGYDDEIPISYCPFCGRSLK